MKKISALIITVIALTGILAGCNSTNYAMEADVNWLGYEKYTYEVTAPDTEEKGTYTVELRLVQNQTFSVGLKHFENVTNQLQITRFSLGDFQIVEVLLFGGASETQKLLPIASYREKTVDGVTSYQTIVYDNAAAKAYAYLYTDPNATLETVTPTEIALSSPYYDNAELYTLFRAAGQTISSWRITVPVAVEGQTVKVSASTSSAATISVPFKSDVTCKTVVFSRSDVSGVKYYAYYSNDDVEIGGKKVKTPLMEIVENGVIYKLKTIEIE